MVQNDIGRCSVNVFGRQYRIQPDPPYRCKHKRQHFHAFVLWIHQQPLVHELGFATELNIFIDIDRRWIRCISGVLEMNLEITCLCSAGMETVSGNATAKTTYLQRCLSEDRRGLHMVYQQPTINPQCNQRKRQRAQIVQTDCVSPSVLAREEKWRPRV